MTLDLEALYIDLHRHPELSFQETRTAGVITSQLTELGIEFEEGIGKTGVVGVIRNPSTGSGESGEGPTVWLRADMDALPVEERTGLAYASTARGTDPSGLDVPVMHACGHDMHVTALLGALERLLATTRRVVGDHRRGVPAGGGVRRRLAGDDRRRRARSLPEARHRARPARHAASGRRHRRALRHSDGGLRRADRHAPRPRRPRLAPALHHRPGRDGRGDRDAAADDRLARGRPAGCRGRHRGLDPRRAQEQHHPRRGEARTEPALPRRRGP